MRLLNNILVPINLNKTTNPQLDTALKLAQRFKSKLILIHVIPEVFKKEKVQGFIDKRIEFSFSEIIRNINHTGIEMQSKILYGDVFEKIISTAISEDVNLILLSNNIEQADGVYSSDSIAENLIRRTSKPVWIAKEGSISIPKNIVCAVDYSDASIRSLNNAIKISRSFSAKLHIININETLQNQYSPRLNLDVTEENRKLVCENKLKFQEFLQDFNLSDISYQVHILEGIPSKQILKFIGKNQAFLLFMGATGKNLIQRLFLGSLTEKIIHKLPCSLVITKSENILNFKLDADISEIEKYYIQSQNLEKIGNYKGAIEQLKICLQINDLHIPSLNKLVKLYYKLGDKKSAEVYNLKIDQVLNRLLNKKAEEGNYKIVNIN